MDGHGPEAAKPVTKSGGNGTVIDSPGRPAIDEVELLEVSLADAGDRFCFPCFLERGLRTTPSACFGQRAQTLGGWLYVYLLGF